MQVTIVPSSTTGQPVHMFATYIVNGVIAVDAGAIGLYGSLADMGKIRHVLLTHSHLDHVATLPPFLDAVYDGSGDCVVIHGLPHTLECLKTDIFNNRLYPDFLKISTIRPPYLKLNEIQPGKPLELLGMKITPVEVNHVVPSVGYLIEDDQAAVLFPSDTYPTEEIWKVASANPKLKAVFLECTFPRELAWLAEIAKHLTPDLYAAEMQKLSRPARFITVHMHSKHRPIVVQQLQELNLANSELGEPGKTYTF